jgi:hypothetical protein
MLIRPDLTLAEEIDALEAPRLQSRPSRRIPKGLKGAPQPTEDQVQRSILNYLRKLPGEPLAWHVRNENDKKLGRNQMFRRKALGRKAGVPDLTICWKGGIVVFVEVKAPGGEISEAQEDRIARLRELGHHVGVAASLDEAIAIFQRAGVVR